MSAGSSGYAADRIGRSSFLMAPHKLQRELGRFVMAFVDVGTDAALGAEIQRRLGRADGVAGERERLLESFQIVEFAAVVVAEIGHLATERDDLCREAAWAACRSGAGFPGEFCGADA